MIEFVDSAKLSVEQVRGVFISKLISIGLRVRFRHTGLHYSVGL